MRWIRIGRLCRERRALGIRERLADLRELGVDLYNQRVLRRELLEKVAAFQLQLQQLRFQTADVLDAALIADLRHLTVWSLRELLADCRLAPRRVGDIRFRRLQLRLELG